VVSIPCTVQGNRATEKDCITLELVGTPNGEGGGVRPRRRLEPNAEVILRETECEVVDWAHGNGRPYFIKDKEYFQPLIECRVIKDLPREVSWFMCYLRFAAVLP
jgi:hypothetical protein